MALEHVNVPNATQGALLVFAEHRYEPLSHPALNGTGSQKCFAYCTTAQANADWAAIVADIRTQHPIRHSLTIHGISIEQNVGFVDPLFWSFEAELMDAFGADRAPAVAFGGSYVS